MSETQPPLMSGMVLGGALISAMGAGGSIVLEKKKPTAKSLIRDFIIGAVMVAMIIQLLPESATTVIQFMLGLAPISLFSKTMTGGGVTSAAAAAPTQEGGATGLLATAASVFSGGVGGAADDVEVKVGVPRF